MKRVAAVHDLCGFGKASLNTIVPILSSMAIQVCAVPTAVLSTHTGGYKDIAVRDLTEYMEEHINHWKKLNLSFDCIYSGYLGSPKQAKIIKEFIEYFKTKDNIVLIDPVMGDDGELYSSITNEMVLEMKNLVSHADIVTPNVTEALMILGKEYKEKEDLLYWKEILINLAELGPKKVVLTSVKVFDNENVFTLAYDKDLNKFYKVETQHINISFPGTGDTFASIMLSYILKGESFDKSVSRACSFIYKLIEEGKHHIEDIREGLPLEMFLKDLILDDYYLIDSKEL